MKLRSYTEGKWYEICNTCSYLSDSMIPPSDRFTTIPLLKESSLFLFWGDAVSTLIELQL